MVAASGHLNDRPLDPIRVVFKRAETSGGMIVFRMSSRSSPSNREPNVLSYRTPPPKVRKRSAWPMGKALAWLSVLFIIFSIARIPREAGHRAWLRSQALDDWLQAELPRRGWEAQRRAGIYPGPDPAWPRPTVPARFVPIML